MKIRKKFNFGLGLLPASVFVDYSSCVPYNPNDIYKEIVKYNTNDIIFHDLGMNNLESLKWLCPRLISEGNFVTLVHKYTQITDIPASRIACFLDIEKFSRNDSMLSHYTENDMLILFTALRQEFLKKMEICLAILRKDKFKGKVMLYKDFWAFDDLLKNDIDYIYRYDGYFLK